MGKRNSQFIFFVFCLFITVHFAVAESDELQSAKQFISSGKFRSALIQLKNAAQKLPDDASIRLLLGKVYLDIGNVASASKELRRARALGAKKDAWRIPLARVFLMQNSPKEALQILSVDNGISSSQKVGIYRMRAQTYLTMSRIKNAKSEIAQAYAIDKNDANVRVVMAQIDIYDKNMKAAEHEVDAALRSAPTNLDAMMIKAILFRNSKDYAAALSVYDDALKLYPHNLPVILDKIVTLINVGDIKIAGTELKSIETRYKNVPAVLYVRGLYALFTERQGDAKNDFEKVMSMVPGHYPSILMLGVINYEQSNFESAKQYLEKYTTAYPGNLKIKRLLGIVYLRLAMPDSALTVFDSLKKSGRDDAQLLAFIASSYMLKKDFVTANAYLAKAARISPDMVGIRTQLAINHLVLGDQASAIDDLNTAVKLDGNFAIADAMLVRIYLLRGEYTLAIKAANGYLKKQPNNPVPYNMLGLIYATMKKIDKAKEYFDMALNKDPAFYTAKINIGKLYEVQGDPVKARKIYTSILSVNSLNAQAAVSLAKLDIQQRHLRGALEQLRTLFSSKPGSLSVGLLYSQLLLADKQYLKALDVSRTLLNRYPNNATVLLSLGRAQIATGDFANARSTFEAINEKYPDNQNSVLMYADILERSGDLGAAGKVLAEYLVRHKPNIPVSMRLGLIDTRQGKHKAALRIATNLQSVASAHAAGLRLRGDVFLDQEKWASALMAYEKSYSGQATSYLALRIYYLKKRLGDASALDGLITWAKAHSNALTVRLVLAQTYMQNGNSSAARKEYKAILKINPTNPLVLNNLAWLYFKQADKRGLEFAQRAYNIAPDRYEVMDTLGWIMLHQGERHKALDLIRGAINQAPHAPQIRYHLAVALYRNGDNVEAKKTLQRLLRSEPSFKDQAAALKLLNSL